MKYNNLTLGQIEAIANKLGGEKGINDFLAGKTKVVSLNGEEVKTFNPNDFFQHRAKGKTQLWLGDNFKMILSKAAETLNIVSVPKYETLKEKTYDKDILIKYGKNIIVYGKNIIVQPIDKVLAEMYAVITSNDPTLADGYSTFWYVEFEGRVFYVYCRWNVYDREWHCHAREVHALTHWIAGDRCASPSATVV